MPNGRDTPDCIICKHFKRKLREKKSICLYHKKFFSPEDKSHSLIPYDSHKHKICSKYYPKSFLSRWKNTPTNYNVMSFLTIDEEWLKFELDDGYLYSFSYYNISDFEKYLKIENMENI